MKFQIVSDSSCDLGREECERLGVTLVSFYASLGDEDYRREERDIATHDFYQMMADRPGVFPKSSTPTVEDYLEAFRPLARAGVPVLCICINGTFSSSLQSARNAAEELEEELPGFQCHVMDSQLVTVLQGEFVREAAELRDEGCTLEEAVAALEPIRSTGRIFFTTNDLEYLRNGGRIGRAAASAGSLLKVKPLIGYRDCELTSHGLARGRKQSLQRVQELFYHYVEQNGLDLRQWRVVTGFGLDREEYEDFTCQLFQGLAERGQEMAVPAPYQIGVTIGVHTGPTPIGVGIIRRAERP